MEGYTNLSGNHQDFDDLDIERRHIDEWKNDDEKRGSKEDGVDEEQKRLLQLKVKLVDGGYGYVFSLRRSDDAVRWRCHLCDVVIVGQVHVETHIQSKKHQVKVAVPAHERDLFTRIEGENAIKIAPGEPVPPGFEDAVVQKQGVPQILAILDCHKSSPLIGLEYLVELVPDERDQEPAYVCVLCNKKGDPRVTMAHLTSFNHRSKYIGINFPTANRAINSKLPRTKAGRTGVAFMVTKICSLIEDKHGRLMPLVLQQSEYEAKKEFYHNQIESSRHFRESPTENYMDFVGQDVLKPYSIKLDDVPLPEMEPPSSEDTKRKIAVDRSRLRSHASKDNDKKNMKREADSSSDKHTTGRDKSRKGVRRNSLSSISSVSSSSLSRSPSPARTRSKSKTPLSSPSPPVLSRGRERKTSDRSRNNTANRFRNRSRSRSPRYPRRMSRSRSNSRSRYRGNPYNRRSPQRSKLSAVNSSSAERSKWEKFRSDTDKMERELTKTLRFHEKNPEKHPMYPEEWKKFWNVRYKELQAEGKDPSSHDFKPEWIKFWDKRMKAMHEEDFKVKREELRQKLNLPKEEVGNPYSFKRFRPQDVEDDIIVISPGPGTSKDVYSKSNWKRKPDSRERKRSLSPWDKDDAPPKAMRKAIWAPTRYPDKGRDRTLSFNPPPRPEYMDDQSDAEPEGGARVITVVRLLTAMESQLGSFGPAVNHMLASALAMDKVRPGSSESMLANPDNLVFFETIKEKLKGQLFAGIVEHGLVMATKACIQNLADMLFRAEKMAAPIVHHKPAAVEPVRAEPVTVPGVGAMDKAAIASQIAAALVAEGRGNVTQEELESLINAVIGMAQASATLDKPMTTAAFVSKMQPPPAAEPPPPVVAAVTPPVKETTSLEKLISVVHSKPAVAPAEPEVPTSQAKTGFKDTYKPTNTCLFPCTIVNDEPVQKERTPTPPRANKAAMSIEDMNLEEMEELTESDLKNLLQNFKELSTKEQYCLITYLKKIEATEPDRVENLRQFVNLAPSQSDQPVAESDMSRPLSPFSLRLGRSNPTLDDSSKRYQLEPEVYDEKIKLDDSDDDYSYEDIYEAASKKVNEKEKEAKEMVLKQADDASKPFSFEVSVNKTQVEVPVSSSPKELNENETGKFLRETEMLIANLMGSLPEKYAKKKSLTPSPSTAKPSTPTQVDLPARANVALNIDISNTLVDAENESNLNAAVLACDNKTLNPNLNAIISPQQTVESQYEEAMNLYDSSVPISTDPYGQQAFQNQYPGNQPNFSNGQGYPQDYPQGMYANQQQYPQQGYPGNYGGNFYSGQPQQQFPPQRNQHPQQQQHQPPQHLQQHGNPQQFNGNYQQQQMGPGGFPQHNQGYQQQRPGYRPDGPPQGYPNQYGGPAPYNQYSQQQQGFY